VSVRRASRNAWCGARGRCNDSAPLLHEHRAARAHQHCATVAACGRLLSTFSLPLCAAARLALRDPSTENSVPEIAGGDLRGAAGQYRTALGAAANQGLSVEISILVWRL